MWMKTAMAIPGMPAIASGSAARMSTSSPWGAASDLGGGWELIDPTGNNTPQALAAVNDWISDNDEQGNLTLHNVVVDDSCFGVWDEDAVAVDVRHDSRTLFFSIFGFADEPNIGAHAKACAGAAQGLGNIVPFQIDNDL